MVGSTPGVARSQHGAAGSMDARRRSPSTRSLLALAALPALAGAALVLLVAARTGPGVTPDSVTYLAAARSLLDGDGFTGADGEPYVAFPPLFPALIAVMSLNVIEPVDAAIAVAAASFGITIAATGWTAGRITGSRAVALPAGLAVLLSTPVLTTALHVWSEPLFMALAMLCLAALAVQGERASRRAVATATGAAALAALARYIGVTLACTQAVMALTRRGSSLAVTLPGAGLALVGLVPLALWLVRNLLVSGTPAGDRYPASATLVENTRAATETLLRWLVPLDAPLRLRAAIVLLLAAALLAAAQQGRQRGDPRTRRLLGDCLPFAVYTALSLTYLVVAASVTALDPIDDRLIAPVLPAIVVLAFSALVAVAAQPRGGVGRLGRAAALTLVFLWLTVSARDTLHLLRRVDADGIGGYAGRTWQASATLRYAEEQLPTGVVYSNDPFAIVYRTERAARLSPRRYPYRSPDATVDDLPGVRAALDSGADVYLVWFDAVPRDFLLSLAELDMILELQPVARLDDGSVYRVRRSAVGGRGSGIR